MICGAGCTQVDYLLVGPSARWTKVKAGAVQDSGAKQRSVQLLAQLADVTGSGTLGALVHLEFDGLALLKELEAVG